MELSETEEKIFKIFGIFLIILSLIFFYYGMIGTNVYKEETITLDEDNSITKGVKFNKGQIVFIKYDIIKGTDEINVFVETGAIHGGNPVNLTEIEDNKFKFYVNETRQYYISFINIGHDQVKIHYKIMIDGYNNNYVCFYAFLPILILGIIIVIVFYIRDKRKAQI